MRNYKILFFAMVLFSALSYKIFSQGQNAFTIYETPNRFNYLISGVDSILIRSNPPDSTNVQEKPEAIYWDMATQPEILASKDFRKTGTSIFYAPADLSEVEWGGPAINNVQYYCGSAMNSTSLDAKNQYIYGDMMRFRFSPTINSWFEWKTPKLVAGKYKVWLCWRREQTTLFRTIFRQSGKTDQVMPFIFDMGLFTPVSSSSSEDIYLGDGWKQYTAKAGTGGVMNSRLLGTIEVDFTGRHILRFEILDGRSGETSWDMIQFIPIDQDQCWPRLDITGKKVYKNTPDCEIWPYTVKVTSNFQGNCLW